MSDNVYSLFLSASVAANDSNVDDADYAMTGVRFVHGQRYNVLYRKGEDITLDSGESRALSFANYSLVYPNEWLFLLAEVSGPDEETVGGASFDLAGKDFNNSSNIASIIPSYGTSLYPGKLLISTYNVTTATVTGLADSTKIRLLAVIPCPDDDARYSENV